MRDFAFYNAGINDAKGPKTVLGLIRRLVRRLLRPMFFHQEAIYHDLQAQIDRLTEQVQLLNQRSASTDAFGWDYVAMARRLAAIEDHLSYQGAELHNEIPSGIRADQATRLPKTHLREIQSLGSKNDQDLNKTI